MIKQLKSGSWLVEGSGPVALPDMPDGSHVGQAAVVVPNKEMQQFITERVKEHTEHALKILIEHQRHTLLPKVDMECSRCGVHARSVDHEAGTCRNCGNTTFKATS